ncbi:MAG: anti-sigma regulatory factor [Cyanobacteria bacterium J06632_22]
MLKQDHLTVQSQLKGLPQVQQWLRHFCAASELDWLDDVFDQLNLALAEGFTNAVRHAHAGLPDETPVCIDLTLWPDQIELRIWDHGQPFDPDVLQEPKPGTLREGGYGWFLLRRLADEIQYQRSDERNCLVIVKKSKIS